MPLPGVADSDLSYIDRLDSVRRYASSAVPVNLAASTVAMAKAYPGISPGLVASLGQAGIQPGSQAESLWQLELASNAGKGVPGQVASLSRKQKLQVKAATKIGNAQLVAQQWDEAGVPRHKIEQVFGLVAKGALQPSDLAPGFHVVGARGATGEIYHGERAVDAYINLGKESLARMQQGPGIGEKVLGTVLGAVGQGISNASTTYAHNQVDPFGVRNVPGYAPAEEVAQAGAKQLALAGQAGLEGVTGAARANFGVQGFPTGIGNGPNTNVNALGIGDFPKAVAEQTTIYQHDVNGLSSGTGILPDWNSPAMQAQANAARQNSPYLIGGHAWTLGRDFAANILGEEPDTQAFNIWSGIVDFTTALKADPVAVGLGKLSAARLEGKTFAPPLGAEEGRALEQSVVGVHGPDVPGTRTYQFTLPTAEEAARAQNPMWIAYDAFKPHALEKVATVDELATAGVGKGPRAWFAPKTNADWVAGSDGRIFLERAAETNDGFDVWMATNKKMPYDLAKRIAEEAHTPDEVYQAIKTHLGSTFRDTFGWDPHLQGRMWTSVPGRTLPGTAEGDIGDAIETTDRMLVNIGQRLNHEEPDVLLNLRRKAFNDWAHTDIASGPGRGAVMHQTFESLRDALKLSGIDEAWVDREIRYQADVTQQIQDYGTGKLGEPLINSHLQNGDEIIPIPHALFEDQFLNHDVPLPDFRALRRMTSRLAPLTKVNAFANSVELADMMMQPWRRLMLMRPAWALRVIGEEQVRIAAFGMDSAFKHPASYLAWMLGNPDDHLWRQLQARELQLRGTLGASASTAATDTAEHWVNLAKARFGRGRVGITGESFFNISDYRDALYGGGERFSAIWDQTPKVYLHEYTNVDQLSEHYPQAMAEELARTANTRLGRAAATMTPDELKQAFWNGDLQSVREHMAQDLRFEPLLTNRAAADEQIDLIYRRLEAIHADNPALTKAIATKQLNGHRLVDFRGDVTQGAKDEIARMRDAGETLPEKMRMRKQIALPEDAHSKMSRYLDNVVNIAFENMMPRESNYLSRGPYDRQMYWMRAEELLPHMDAESRAQMLVNAEYANLDSGIPVLQRGNTMAALRRAADSPIPEHAIDLATADELAGRYALHATKDLLYDLADKSQFMDAARLLFPFGEAFREVVTRWAKLVYEHPEILRRVEQGIMGARSPGSNIINTAFGGSTLTDPATGKPLNNGLLFRNDRGQEIFAFPGTELLTKAITGVPVPLTGSLSGLNMIGNGMPGLGPMVQLPLAWMLPDKPQTEQIRKWLFPVGDPDSNPYNAITSAFLPTYARRFLTQSKSPNSDREYAGAVKDAANYLASTGDYDLQGPKATQEVARLLSDAKNAARQIYLIRGFGAASLPSSPSSEWLAADKSGNLTAQWRISQWFHEQAKKTSYDKTVKEYYDLFGQKNFLILQPKWVATVRGADQLASVSGSRWAKENQSLSSDFPLTYGLFAPDSTEFNYQAYQDQFANGQRRGLTPADMVHLANERLANYAYHNALKEAEASGAPSVVQQAYLRSVRETLYKNFPGYGFPHYESAEPIVYINEVIKAANDPRLRSNPATPALREYLTARDDALAYQRNIGLAGSTISTAASAAVLRAYLRFKAETIIKKNPAFKVIFDTVFSSETEDQ